jgi:hypothetical protein
LLYKMRLTDKLVLSLWLIICSAAVAEAKDWRGIKPLVSTRTDVVQLLGPPATDRGDFIFYEFEKERVSFRLSGGSCRVGSGGWNVPRGVVIEIWVTPKPNQLKLADLSLDEAAYRKEQDREVLCFFHYTDDAAGVAYEVDTCDGDMVTLIQLFPASGEARLRCPKTYEELERTLKVGEYADLPSAVERRRLDAFVDELQRHSHKDPAYADTMAYILAYAGRRHRRGEAAVRAERAKEYLVKAHRIDRRRIVTVDGGYREAPSVELYLVPAGGNPPLATPTVEPSETQVVGGERRKHKRRSKM